MASENDDGNGINQIGINQTHAQDFHVLVDSQMRDGSTCAHEPYKQPLFSRNHCNQQHDSDQTLRGYKGRVLSTVMEVCCWYGHLCSGRLHHNAGVKTPVCNVAVAAMFVEHPWVGTHESGVNRSVAVTTVTRTSSVLVLAAILFHLPLLLRTQHGLFSWLGMRVTGLRFEEVHSMAPFGPMRAETALSVWVMIDSVFCHTGISHLFHVLVLYKSVSQVQGASDDKRTKLIR